MPSVRSLWPLGLLVAALLAGCSEVGVRRAGSSDLLAAFADDLPPRTLQTLRRHDLESLYRRAPAEAYARLQAAAVNQPQPDLVFALAELSYVLARQAERWEAPDAIALYYLSAGYAYHYLFDPRERTSPGGNPYDPQFRLACDLYNAGLTKCIRAAQRVGRLDPRHELRLPAPDGSEFTLSVVHHGFAWQPDEFGTLLFADDFEPVGLENHYRTYGLGVPLIAVRSDPADLKPGPSLYPPEVSFPVTAFFRFDGSLADLTAQRAGRLELYNPLAVQAVEVAGRSVPLETDLTTPLAYYLSRARLDGLGLTGFLNVEKLSNRAGVYLVEPYQPGKVPVLFVHGLLSSPVTWAPLFNDLLADPVLRKHYQFWFCLYPTGNPYLVTAADLRRQLTGLRQRLDPGRRDPALDDMVLVGHSMGGLVAKLLATEGGDDFWHLVSSEPLASLKVKPETRAELQQLLYFERQPYVRRVVFLGTPHHGSRLSPSPVGRLAAELVQLPRGLTETAAELTRDNARAPITLRGHRLPTSIDLLAPGSPALELIAHRPRPPAVHFHSVIGILPPGRVTLDRVLAAAPGDERGDGVVSYASAHLDGVDSELVVPADHSHVHHHPLAVAEVRRVLLEHWEEFRLTVHY